MPERIEALRQVHSWARAVAGVRERSAKAGRMKVGHRERIGIGRAPRARRPPPRSRGSRGVSRRGVAPPRRPFGYVSSSRLAALPPRVAALGRGGTRRPQWTLSLWLRVRSSYSPSWALRRRKAG